MDRRMKTTLFGLLAAVTLLAGTDRAAAQISGTVSGCVRVTEARGELIDPTPLANQGALHRLDRPDAQGRIPVPEVVIRFTFTGANPQQLIEPVFVRTDRNGCYTARWTDWTRSQFPTSAQMAIMWSHSEVVNQRNSPLPIVFSIRGSSGGVLVSQRNFSLGATSTVDRNMTGETALAYVTTWEFFDRVVRGPFRKGRSDLLIERMRGLQVWTRQPPISGGFGLAPSRNRVLVSTGIPTALPSTLAHELGHIATWNALDLVNAPLSLSDYGLDLTWGFTTRESERAAFLEGMAIFFSSIWMWSRTAPEPALTRGRTIFQLERGRSIAPALGARGGPLIVTFTCATTTFAHERAFCHAAALRDLYDAPATDDDGSTRRFITSIVNTLDGYPDSCPFWNTQGCSNEFGPTGFNHNDFRRNFRPAPARAAVLTPIYNANGLAAGAP